MQKENKTMQQPGNLSSDVIRNAVFSDPASSQMQNTTQIVRDAAQTSEDAAIVAQDAVQVIQDVQQTQQTQQALSGNTPVQSVPLQTNSQSDDTRLNALITRLASTDSAQVQQFQDARREIQTLQVQTTEVPASLPNASMVLASGAQPQLPVEASDALFLFQQSMHGIIQALGTVTNVLEQYTQSVEQNTITSTKPSLQIQANLAQSYGKEALTLANLAQNVVAVPSPIQFTAASASPVFVASEPMNSVSSIVSQGFDITQILGPLLELIPALFL
jgi:hypothetical protein